MANKIIGIMKYSRAARLSKPNDKESEKKIYAVAQSDETINLNHLATHMAEHTSPFSVGTIKGVLADAVGCIVELLCQGKRVQLEGLGTFFTSLKSTGADSADEFSAANITAVVPHIAFDKATWDGMRSKVDFELVATRELQAQAKKEHAQSLDQKVGSTGTGGSTGGNNGGQADPGDVTP
jgi:predicted histone-like DNA-binding protein